mmetsp:Transcript_22812/g.40895  ORF Transcript_22812/g.40895 Transcript_22812/m.40895 type:complete len:275 (+) Transcript_22812:1062-1886(+)
MMANGSSSVCKCHTSRPTTNQPYVQLFVGRNRIWFNRYFRFVTCTWIDQATGSLSNKRMIQTCLIARNACIYFLILALSTLLHDIWICQEWPSHGDEISAAIGQYRFNGRRGIDAVRGAKWNRDNFLITKLFGDEREGTARYASRNCGNSCFVPSNSRVDNSHAHIFQCLCQCRNLLPGTSIVHQIQHAKPENDNEIQPTCLTGLIHYLHRQPHSIPKILSSIFIITMICLRNQKLINQVSLTAHDFHTIVSRLFGQHGAIDKITNGTLNIRSR